MRSFLSARPRIAYDSCEPKQLRAGLQPGAFRRFDVYLEPSGGLLGRQIDHSASFREPIHVADREHRGFMQHFKDPWQIVLLRRADKQDVAIGNFLDCAEPLYRNRSALQALSADSVIERLAK